MTMGWSSGTEICGEILDEVTTVLAYYDVKRTAQVRLIARIIKIFENADCDTTGELEGRDKVINDALKLLHPEWYEEL